MACNKETVMPLLYPTTDVCYFPNISRKFICLDDIFILNYFIEEYEKHLGFMMDNNSISIALYARCNGSGQDC